MNEDEQEEVEYEHGFIGYPDLWKRQREWNERRTKIIEEFEIKMDAPTDE